jgi:hypothetical protein
MSAFALGETPDWATVAEMTGLKTHAAKVLLRSVGGDVQTAVLLHFEGEAALIGGSGGQGIAGKRQRLQEWRDERLRSVGGVGYDAFDASKYRAPVKNKTGGRRTRRRMKSKNKATTTKKEKKNSGEAGVFAGFADSSPESGSESDGSGGSSSDGSAGSNDNEADVNGATLMVELRPPAKVVGPDGEAAFWTCQYTKKTFKSRAQAENFMHSKRYQAMALQETKRLRREARRRSACPDDNGNDNDHAPGLDNGHAAHDHDEEEEGWVTDSSDSDSDTDSWTPDFHQCLFDSHVSASFEANALYMRDAYSFFVPNVGCLVDPKGLFSYLQEKVTRYHLCLTCNRSFVSIPACRNHMIDAAHCRIDIATDVTAREFYDVGSLAARTSGLRGATRSFRGATASQLRLSSGRMVGHRDLQRYYRQNVKEDQDGRLAVVANRENAQRRSGGGGAAGATRRGRGAGIVLGSPSSLQQRIRLRHERKRVHGVLTRDHRRFKGTSKAIASTYVYKPGAADNKHRRAIVHHAGSHFHMAGSRQFHRGVRVKGVKFRSRRGANLSSAMTAKRVKKGNSSSNRGNRRFDHRRG